MEKRIISAEIMKYIAMFESIARVHVKDCFIDELTKTLTFVVTQGQIGKAVGKGAINVKKMEKKLNRKIKVVEFNSDVKSFIKSLLFPLKVADVSEVDEGIFLIEPIDTKTRGLIIGRAASNLRNTEKVLRRFYDIKELKVS